MKTVREDELLPRELKLTTLTQQAKLLSTTAIPALERLLSTLGKFSFQRWKTWEIHLTQFRTILRGQKLQM